MPAAFTVRVDDETLAALDKLAARTERPRNWLVKEALKTYLDIQAWQVAKIEAGIAAADRGEFAADEDLDAIEAELESRMSASS
jgi:predicted transcriptional regulator